MVATDVRLYLVLDCILALLDCPQSITVSKHSNDVATRIVGAKKKGIAEVPYQVGMETSDGTRYSGALLSTDRVLTVAQLKSTCRQKVKVYLGASEFENLNEEGRINMDIPCADVIPHEQYDPVSGINDIAIIKLPKKVELTDHIQLAPMPNFTHELFGTYHPLQVSGWGSRTVNYASTLRIIRGAKSEGHNTCMEAYKISPAHQLCIKTGEGVGHSVCTGDGGALLYVPQKKFQCIIGLASRIMDDCKFRRPNIYTRITAYLQWISDKMK